jgi:hypothetical protein
MDGIGGRITVGGDRVVRNFGRVAVLLVGIGSANAAFAQTPAPAPGPPKELTLRQRLETPDQGGAVMLTGHLGVALGGIKSGSGIALGPAVSFTFADGGYLQLKAEYSVRKFKLLQLRYDTHTFWAGRAMLVSRLRWQDAPKLSIYRLGPDAPDLKVNYGERRTEGVTRLRVQLRPRVRIATGFGVEKYATSGGRIDLAGDNSLPSVPPLPGLGTNPWFAHALFLAAWDSRTSPDYSRSGRAVEGAVHYYRDVHDNQDGFGRFDGLVQQLIPHAGEKGVLDLSAQTWLSLSDGERSVPFFLMPTLGGSNYLRAYPSYRFRDRHAMMLKAEYRWMVHKMVDVAGVYEVGKVAPEVSGLRLKNTAESAGAGIRVHSKTSSLVDLDIAHGRDGFKFTIGFSSRGS